MKGRDMPARHRGFLIAEAMAALVIVGIVLVLVVQLAIAARDHRDRSRAALAATGELTARAEALRAAAYEELVRGAPHQAQTVELDGGTRCRVTTRIAVVDPAPGGLAKITVTAELLDEDGDASWHKGIELMKAQRQW